jgi:hypothetical protein
MTRGSSWERCRYTGQLYPLPYGRVCQFTILSLQFRVASSLIGRKNDRLIVRLPVPPGTRDQYLSAVNRWDPVEHADMPNMAIRTASYSLSIPQSVARPVLSQASWSHYISDMLVN